ncbi:MAG: flagellar protein FlgN [Lachnospiraceae bacterium]|jgi:flagellar biosynthesis/type III secretory pathway chaperone|nr:flagellar protein FlgN [Lachnospiraceae bacterium]MCR5390770.1 flagellar protein FlgN [Lachnospiraceae bacterium]
MASLIDELIDTLNREDEEYNRLIALSREKTPIIVKGDLEGLAAVTDKEQSVVSVIQKLEKDRMSSMKDIAEVTNRSEEELKLTDLIELMKGRPEEQKKLREVHDRLQQTMKTMTSVNEQNRTLLQNSLDMVQFEMQLLQSMRQAPETADYGKDAYSTGTIMGSGTKRFDAKQ